MNDYVGTLAKHRRLTILKFLADCAEYTSNASILVEICNKFGVTSTRDQVAGDLSWMRDNGMVTYEDHGDFIVVTATGHGVEIADGRARHEGVQRPRPGV